MSPLPAVVAGAFCFLTHLQEAEFEDGILMLKLPKAEEVKPKAIKVKGK